MKKKKWVKLLFVIPLLLAAAALHYAGSRVVEGPRPSGLRFGISFPEEHSREPLDDRILLMISADGSREPRFQISDGPETQLIFGVDVDGLKPGERTVIDKEVFRS